MTPDIRALLDAAKNPEPVAAASKARVAVKLAHSLSVTPQWWQTGAAKVLVVSAVAAGALWGAARLRVSAPIRAQEPVAVVAETPVVAPSLAPTQSAAKPVSEIHRSAPKLVTRKTAAESEAVVHAIAHDRLDEERRLLDNARFALLHHDSTTAAMSLERYDREFAHGVLEEERAALWVQAHAAKGEVGRARDAAHAFLLTYPDSVQRDAVLDVLTKISDGNAATPQ